MVAERDDVPASTAETSESGDSTKEAPRPGRRWDVREMVIGLLVSMVFDIGLSIAIFSVAKNLGASDLAAYLYSSIGPLVGMAIEFVRHRRIDIVGVVILAVIALSLAVTLIGSDDPTVLLLKDSALTGGLGVVILASLTPLFPRPLMYYLGRKFGTDGTEAGTAWWASLWQYPSFRRSQRVITGVWGAGYLAEAIAKVAWVLALPFDTAYLLNQVVPLAVTVVLMVWTMWYAARTRRAGERRASRSAPPLA
ncbi:MAG: VC0807 family protein [Micropruina sp.]|uniref:VC0807 family protein n=1 Tax=Micropruina sp. TaxID=2737536 RepID=UPI0039E46B4A